LDSNFNNDSESGGAPPATAEQDKSTLSPAGERFLSCRWRKPAENGTPDHCTHRDVLPMAGTTGFVPESWCADCAYYKAKRSPRKRPAQEPDTSWRW
jgi:hypothetical protein